MRFAHKYRWYDEKGQRKIHTVDTPRLGGVGIFVSFFVAAMIGFYFVAGPEHIALWTKERIALLIIGMAVMHGLGIYDDFVNLRAPLKFLIQIISAVIVVFSGALIQSIAFPLIGVVHLPTWLAVPATVIWIVSIANAVNLIDGADGLAAGYSGIAAFFMGVIAFGEGNLLTAILAFALVGSLIGFLIFNFPPAKIFMGDGGSLFLGFFLAVLPVVGLNGRNVENQAIFLVVPTLSLLYLPIMDTILAIIRRSLRGLPVHSPDREHIHHRLIDRGFIGRRLIAVIYSGSILFGLAGMSWFTLPGPYGSLLNVGLWILVTVILVRIGKTKSVNP